MEALLHHAGSCKSFSTFLDIAADQAIEFKGDAVDSWRSEAFVMVKDGPVWHPPVKADMEGEVDKTKLNSRCGTRYLRFVHVFYST